MLYSILIYDAEANVDALTEDEEAARIAVHSELQERLRAENQLRFVGRLMPSTAATSLRPGGTASAQRLVVDGPFAETKEQLLGFYVVECDSMAQALDAARGLPLVTGTLEVRPVSWSAFDDLPDAPCGS